MVLLGKRRDIRAVLHIWYFRFSVTCAKCTVILHYHHRRAFPIGIQQKSPTRKTASRGFGVRHTYIESDLRVRAVAERRVLRHLASAQMVFAVLVHLECLGGERRAVMRAVAERLILASAAGTPVIFLSCLQFDGIREFLSDNGFIHIKPP